MTCQLWKYDVLCAVTSFVFNYLFLKVVKGVYWYSCGWTDKSKFTSPQVLLKSKPKTQNSWQIIHSIQKNENMPEIRPVWLKRSLKMSLSFCQSQCLQGQKLGIHLWLPFSLSSVTLLIRHWLFLTSEYLMGPFFSAFPLLVISSLLPYFLFLLNILASVLEFRCFSPLLLTFKITCNECEFACDCM